MRTQHPTPARQRESYRQQLRRIARAMATARTEEVYGDLERGSRADMMKLFVDGNLDKRLDKLDKQLEFVKEAFDDDFEELAVAFIKSLPLVAYDSGQFDGERFLAWLEQTQQLSAEQRDYIACQRARHAVENMGRNHRLAHVRFQEWASLADELAGEMETNNTLLIHLNPIRVWTRFETPALLDDDAQPPADVLFFAVRNDTSTAMLEVEGRRLLEELVALAPISLESWSAVSQHADREQLVELCSDLAKMGLVAFS